MGAAGEAEVRLELPHEQAALTDLNGDKRKELPRGSSYRFPVRPQQIVTMRFRTKSAVPEVPPLLAWDPLAPKVKRAMLHEYSNEKGYPPLGH